MNIAEGSNEYLLPKNVGIFFFGKDLKRFLPYDKIEFVIFRNEAIKDFSEKIFEGPIHLQLQNALNFS